VGQKLGKELHEKREEVEGHDIPGKKGEKKDTETIV
jgi:hypothetical protein